MIQANELRIGNNVQDVGVLEKNLTVYKLENGIIVCGDEGFSYPYLSEHLQGIPLTHDVFINCGFTFLEIGRTERYKLNRLYINHAKCFGGYFKYGHFTKIKYLHQLQNLYFALTGQELDTTRINQ